MHCARTECHHRWAAETDSADVRFGILGNMPSTVYRHTDKVIHKYNSQLRFLVQARMLNLVLEVFGSPHDVCSRWRPATLSRRLW